MEEHKDKDKDQYLQFLQGIITRMNSNSFSLKGWMITIVSAFVALYVDKGNMKLLLAPIGSTLLFWLLDAYYLQQERKFISMFKDAVSGILQPYDMDLRKYTKKSKDDNNLGYWNALTSVTVMPIYLTTIALLIICAMVLH